jgi:hypothetical protein
MSSQEGTPHFSRKNPESIIFPNPWPEAQTLMDEQSILSSKKKKKNLIYK